MQIEQLEKFLAQPEPVLGLVICTEAEAKQLAAQGLPVELEDTTLSMQHLKLAKLAAARLHQGVQGAQLLCVTPAAEEVTPSESALIYALLVRCRKVISCRDKLEDMLKYADREGWQAVKAAYETKVLDLYKATWRDEIIYPYNIVDNIKEYNKNESYILKQLYWHLSERTPGKINAGDMPMMRELRQMFSDLSVSLLAPAAVFVGSAADVELAKLAEAYRAQNIPLYKL